MKSRIKEIKQQQKERAEEIRALKSQRKTYVSKYYNRVTGYIQGLDTIQYQYRLNHIVYCLLRGRKPEEIENRWRDPEDHNNRYIWKQAAKIIQEVYTEFEIKTEGVSSYETIRANSKRSE